METIIQTIESITFLLVLKVLIVALLMVYAVFAFLIMKQVGSMTRAITMKDDYLIKILATAHFAFAVVVLVLAIVVL